MENLNKNIKVGICLFDDDGNIVESEIVSQANWSINLEQDLWKNHKIHMIDEISNFLRDELLLNLKETDFMKTLIRKLHKKVNECKE